MLSGTIGNMFAPATLALTPDVQRGFCRGRQLALNIEDETHFTDSQQRVLPDAFLLPRGSTALDLAYKVHTDIGDSFIRAIAVSYTHLTLPTKA